MQNTLVYSIRVLQGSVATRLGCDGIFSDSFVANFSRSVPAKEFWKFVAKWQSYWYKLGILVSWNTVSVCMRMVVYVNVNVNIEFI